MASFLQRLVRKQTLATTNLSNRILTPSTHLLDSTKPSATAIPFFNGVPKTTTTDELNPNHHSLYFYPTFAFETFLNPIPQIEFIQSTTVPEVLEEEEEGIGLGDDEKGIWADSVKKKRKKKMNKHKLKKLRKRLRRKT